MVTVAVYGVLQCVVTIRYNYTTIITVPCIPGSSVTFCGVREGTYHSYNVQLGARDKRCPNCYSTGGDLKQIRMYLGIMLELLKAIFININLDEMNEK